MRIRDATQADLPSILAANSALASETEGQTLDGALLSPGVQAVLDDPGLGVYARFGLHRSNYGVMETVCRGPESHEEAPPC